MIAAAMSLLIVFAVTLGILSVVLYRKARLRELRLESLARPLHELRGALGALELGLSFLERSSSSVDANESIEALRHSLGRATLGARDVEAVRRGNAGAAAGAHVNFNILVLRSARAWRLLAPAYDATLEVDWRAGPVRVKGQAGRLQQALDNLMANALEHGGGRVLVEGERRGRRVRVILSDGGRGVARSLEGVCDGECARSAVSSERGHGLSIARAVIVEHGGRLAPGMGRHGPGLLIELPIADGDGGASARFGLRGTGAEVCQVASNAA